MTTRPSPVLIDLDGIPETLRATPRWVLWRFELREGRRTKVPISARTGGRINPLARENWSSFEVVRDGLARGVGDADGIGVVFDGSDRLMGVDLDDCIDESGDLSAEAKGMLRELSTYSEISPSGRGVKAFVRGDLPPGSRCRLSGIAGMSALEIYRAGRFFTVTGRRLDGYPAEVMDRPEELEGLHRRVFACGAPALQSRWGGGPLEDDQIIERARRASHSGKFTRLFDSGDRSGHGDDDSVADLALCGLLTRWTQDPAQIDRLFRRSALMRPKWDAARGPTTYGGMTIAKALSGGGGGRAHPPAMSGAPAEGRVTMPLFGAVRMIVEHAEVSGGVARVTVGLEVDGEAADGSVMLTTTPRRKREGAEEMLDLLASVRPGRTPTSEERAAVKSAIVKVTGLTTARQLERRLKAASEGGERAARQKVVSIARQFLKNRFDPRFRVRDGSSDAVWSERAGRVCLRSELIDLADRELLEELAPRSAWAVARGARYAAALAQLRALLRVVVEEMLGDLPAESGAADLGPESKAAAEFWKRLLAAMLAPAFQVRTAGGPLESMSVAEQVQRRRAEGVTGDWRRLLPCVPAWVRGRAGPGGEVKVQLAIRHELVGGAIRGHKMAAASDARSFTVIARRYGAADPEASVVTRSSEKAERIVVLSDEFTRRLLGCLEPGE